MLKAYYTIHIFDNRYVSGAKTRGVLMKKKNIKIKRLATVETRLHVFSFRN